MPPGIVRICSITSKHQFAAVTGGNICVRSIGHISRHGDKAELTIFGFVKPGKTRRGLRGFCPGPGGSDPGKTGCSSPLREGKKKKPPRRTTSFFQCHGLPREQAPGGAAPASPYHSSTFVRFCQALVFNSEAGSHGIHPERGIGSSGGSFPGPSGEPAPHP